MEWILCPDGTTRFSCSSSKFLQQPIISLLFTCHTLSKDVKQHMFSGQGKVSQHKSMIPSFRHFNSWRKPVLRLTSRDIYPRKEFICHVTLHKKHILIKATTFSTVTSYTARCTHIFNACEIDWICLYLTTEGMKENKLLVVYDLTTMILCILHKLHWA